MENKDKLQAAKDAAAKELKGTSFDYWGNLKISEVTSLIDLAMQKYADQCLTDGDNWISVKERLPDGRPVLVWNENYYSGDAAVAYRCAEGWVLFNHESSNDPIEEPTHWMPLPEPPKQ